MSAPARELTVIGVDLLPWLVDELAALPDDHPLFDLLVIDETSRLKDPSGKAGAGADAESPGAFAPAGG